MLTTVVRSCSHKLQKYPERGVCGVVEVSLINNGFFIVKKCDHANVLPLRRSVWAEKQKFRRDFTVNRKTWKMLGETGRKKAKISASLSVFENAFQRFGAIQ